MTMKTTKIWMLAILFIAFAATSCSEDEDPINEAEDLLSFLEAGDADYEQWVNTLDAWIVNYGDITLADYFVLDIRSATDYGISHLPNAENATMATMFDVIDTENTGNLPILVVCYSGQSASYAHTLLRLKGYEAYVLKWGMSIVADSLDKWTSKFLTLVTLSMPMVAGIIPVLTLSSNLISPFL